MIGGGSIGLWSALALLERGHEVIVLEAGSFLEGCSLKNSGLIVPSHVVPLAAPGIVAKGLKWLADAKSPFYLRPSLDPSLVRWGALFHKSANATQAKRSAAVLARLSIESLALFRTVARNLDFGFRESGLLMLCRTPGGFEEELKAACTAKRLGVQSEELSASKLANHEPLADCAGGVLYPGDAQLDPTLMVAAVANHLRTEGAELWEHCGPVSLSKDGGRVLASVGAETVDADWFVLACGAQSGAEMANLGHRMPMVGGKGYSFEVSATGLPIQRPTILVEDRVALSPLGKTVRLGGTMEIGTDPAKVAKNRVQGIADAVPRFLQAQSPEPSDVWSGLRPCSPDGLPYVGRTRAVDNLIVATGHAMLGITLSPVTGKLVADSLEGVDDTELSPDRFA